MKNSFYKEKTAKITMHRKKELPILRGEELYIPFVGAIIERINREGKKEILIQIRQKASDEYHNSIEIPGGKLKAFEDIYEAVRREVKEESGLEISFIHGENKRIDYPNREDISTLVEPFCITQMKNGPFIGVIFLCRAIGEPLTNTDETKEAKWIDCEELMNIVNSSPEKIYTAFLAPLKKYLNIKDNNKDLEKEK